MSQGNKKKRKAKTRNENREIEKASKKKQQIDGKKWITKGKKERKDENKKEPKKSTFSFLMHFQ